MDLAPFAVPAGAIAAFVLANNSFESPNNMGVRASGSALARLIDLPEADLQEDLYRVHVLTDATATVEFFHEDVSDLHIFHLVGYWTGQECGTPADCDDGLFCNGDETCDPADGCQPGSFPCTDPAVPVCDEPDGECVECLIDDDCVGNPNGPFCNVGLGVCAECLTDAQCQDQLFCNGAEACVGNACQAGTPPELDDGVACTVDTCDEDNNVIVHTPDNGLCADGQFCNGIEICDAVGGCQPGTGPCTDPGLPVCDEPDGECVECLTNSDCGDNPNGPVCDVGPDVCTPGPLSCESGAGDCCVNNGTPGCGIVDCCEVICAVFPFCCDVSWDGQCALEAFAEPICNCAIGPCGAGAGDCCTNNGTPACDNVACCEAICSIDPFCCTDAWDSTCSEEAWAEPICGCVIGPICGNGACDDSGDPTSNCCVSNDTLGCDDSECEAAVCACDPFCCENEWDFPCATTGNGGNGCGAVTVCGDLCIPGSEDCANCLADCGCDDGNACTFDTCVGGACSSTDTTPPGQCCDPLTGTLTPIDDGNACSSDVCHPDGTVTHAVPGFPFVEGIGSRAIVVIPNPPDLPVAVALLLTSPNFPCLSKYIDPTGTLVDTPVFQTPAEWGAVIVSDQDIVPSTNTTETVYRVEAECGGALSDPGAGVTFIWGDLNDDDVVDFDDIVLLLNAFSGNFDLPLEVLDIFPCEPNGVIDFDDILFVLLAFAGDPFPCAAPCDAGACCLNPVPLCEILLAEECSDQGGAFLGSGTTCVPNPCQ